jgi:CpXC protein
MKSIKGTVTFQCKGKCPPFEAEIWTLIRGDEDIDLKEAALGGELNLISCPHCHEFFYGESPLVYLDKENEILIFAFPKDYEKDKAKWQRKMDEDFELLKNGLLKEMQINYKPVLVFGTDKLKEFLSREGERREETEVIGCLANEMNLKTQKVKPAKARECGLPNVFPFAGDNITKETVLKASQKLIKGRSKIKSLSRLIEHCDDDKTDISDLI